GTILTNECCSRRPVFPLGRALGRSRRAAKQRAFSKPATRGAYNQSIPWLNSSRRAVLPLLAAAPAALPAQQTPVKIVAPNDKHPSRCMRQVTVLRLEQAD